MSSSSPIEANFTLAEASSNTPAGAAGGNNTTHTSPGEFRVLAQTVNGPLSATFATSSASAGPVARLSATLSTQNGPARVELPPMFAGTFELRGFPFLPPVFTERPYVPSAGGRVRRVQRTGVGLWQPGVVSGRVWWEPARADEHPGSTVSVVTSNAPLRLIL